MGRHLLGELDKIKRKLLSISSLVESNLNLAVVSVRDLDRDAIKQVHENDYEIDMAEVELEEDCLKALALYQPVASDLRFLVVALKINNDLERIGDLAVNLAQRATFLADLEKIEIPFDYETMTRQTRDMVKKSIEALIEMDGVKAREVIADDDVVDKINRNMYQTVFERVKVDPENSPATIHYLAVSRFLERIADYATNIAEDIIYMIDGVIVRHHSKELISKN